jgi:hypothetical protein
MTWTFEQVLQSMRELDAFLKRIGLHTEAGRFSIHIKAIELLMPRRSGAVLMRSIMTKRSGQ